MHLALLLLALLLPSPPPSFAGPEPMGRPIPYTWASKPTVTLPLPIQSVFASPGDSIKCTDTLVFELHHADTVVWRNHQHLAGKTDTLDTVIYAQHPPSLPVNLLASGLTGTLYHTADSTDTSTHAYALRMFCTWMPPDRPTHIVCWYIDDECTADVSSDALVGLHDSLVIVARSPLIANVPRLVRRAIP